ncbi:MAG: hypothetical protein GF364_22450 [Candidatus Lokiarchaeota archaeon]|nr:hypothetical protein [Candidatus Lokiarchaeota archaeon]
MMKLQEIARIWKNINIGVLIAIISLILSTASLFSPWYEYILQSPYHRQIITLYPFDGWLALDTLSEYSRNPSFPSMNTIMISFIGLIMYNTVVLFICMKNVTTKILNEEQNNYLYRILFIGPILSCINLVYLMIQFLISGLYFPFLTAQGSFYTQTYTIHIGFLLNLISIILSFYSIFLIRKMMEPKYSYISNLSNFCSDGNYDDAEDPKTEIALKFEEDSQLIEDNFIKQQLTLLSVQENLKSKSKTKGGK